MFQRDHSPTKILNTLWDSLASAGVDPGHPFRFPCLANIREQRPCQRLVVLRGAEATEGTLWCHTDIRSPKIKQLAASAETSWLFWDPETRTQLTAVGPVTLHQEDEFAERVWGCSEPRQRLSLADERAPGDELSAPPDDLTDSWDDLSEQQRSIARSRFVVLSCAVQRLDATVLSPGRNLRISFDRAPDDAWRAVWRRA